MIRIEYSKSGKAYSDFELDEACDEIISKYYKNYLLDQYINCSSENIILALRLKVATETIDYKHIVMVFCGKELELNEYGCLNEYPEGFCGKMDYIYRQLLKEQGRIRIKNRQ